MATVVEIPTAIKTKARILIVDDELVVRDSLGKWFEEEGYRVETATTARDALLKLPVQRWDVALVDIKMPGMDGLELQRKIREVDAEILIIIMTGYASVETAVQALKDGAYDYITKPFDVDELRLIVSRSLSTQALQKEVKYLRKEVDKGLGFESIIGNSDSMKETFNLIRQIADSKSTVLIMGESGTGKELVSRAIHYNSQRKNYPFVTINCAAIPETLIESELFGHEKGAFTNAIERKLGRFEIAHEGTLFLDEIGELSLATQAKILRFLEEKEFNRVGGSKTIKVDVRLIAATNKDLSQMIKKGTFREDLYYRINVVPMILPPLRERPEDIPLLVDHFIERFSTENKKQVKSVSNEALEILKNYEWPGNVRELENLMERVIALTSNTCIQPNELPFSLVNMPKLQGLKESI
ncbi:MAG: sigma-54 dependent transcriptional regulator, partial [Acidobacteriia bacterium]|nr:sigma-54 dependent transcriptional regulator [Terriglobia bacterium]